MVNKTISNTPDKNGNQVVRTRINDMLVYEVIFNDPLEAKIAFKEQCDIYGLLSEPPKTRFERLHDWFRKIRGIKDD